MYYIVDKFYYCLLIMYKKTLVVLNCQQFIENPSNDIESSVSKRQLLDKQENKEKLCLHKSEVESEGEIYISFPLIAYLPPPEYDLKGLTHMGEETKRLNHFICIYKI